MWPPPAFATAGNCLTPLGADGADQLPNRNFEKRHDLLERGVANDEDRRIVGTDPPVVKTDKVVAGDGLHPGFGARSGKWNAVGMVGSVKQGRKNSERKALRLSLFLGDAGQEDGALALDVLGLEGRVADNVGEKIERGGKVGLKRRQADRRIVHRRVLADVRSKTLLIFGDRDGISRGSSPPRQARGRALRCRAWPCRRRHCRRRS